MLRTRLLTAAILVPVAIGAFYAGGLPHLALTTLLLMLAEVEFCRLVARNGFRPTLAFGLGMVGIFLLDAQLDIYAPELGVSLLEPGLAVILLESLTWQLFHRQDHRVANWALTIVGGLYLGVCGACLIRLRGLPDGFWWTMTAIPAVLLADTAAYFAGRAWGRHKLAPTLSPGKTWEGYLAGVFVGGLATALLATLWHTLAGPESTVNGVHGLILGLLVAALAPLGDLAVSMIKREVGAKDSGTIIPGHGGALDRIDSILWAMVIGYYYALWVAV